MRATVVLTRNLIILLTILSGCASPRFTDSQRVGKSESSDVIVETYGCGRCIERIVAADSGRVVYDVTRDGEVTQFRLRPGTYTIALRKQMKYKAPFQVSRTDTVALRGGETYAVQGVYCLQGTTNPACRGHGERTGTLWIEEASTGHVVTGEKWDARFECRTVNLSPVGRESPRIELAPLGVSIVPPQGANWCQYVSPDGVTFSTNPLVGTLVDRPIRAAEMANIVSAWALVVELEAPQPNTLEDLRAYVARWLQGGGGYRRMGSQVVLTPLRQFRTVSSSVVLDRSLGADCVRYDAVIEEPYAQTLSEPAGVIIRDNRRNLVCRHPHRTGFVWIGYSEKWQREPTAAVQGALAPRTSLLEAYRTDLETFPGSLRFSTP